MTGVYELEDAHAWVERGSEKTGSGNFDGETTGLVPLSLRAGPFQSGNHLTFNIQVKGKQVWAARFHQLKLDYVRQSSSETRIPSNIVLLADTTVAGEEIMGADSPVEEKQVCEGNDSIRANGADLALSSDIEEFEGEGTDEYRAAWNEAVQKLEHEARFRLEDEENEDDESDEDDEDD